MVENNFKVSVIIPVYNTAEYLPRCLDSILNNTHKNLEIICVNDGSTDESAYILERYATEDTRIVVVNQTNAGVSAARNTGLDRATGEFVSFIDSDDWVHPQYFEALLFAQKITSADTVACRYKCVSSREDELAESISYCAEDVSCISLSEAIKGGYLKRLVWGRIYKRSCLKVRFENGLGWGEDTVFNLCTLSINGLDQKFGAIAYPLYFYFSRPESITSTVSAKRCVELPKWYLKNWNNVEFPTEMQAFLLEQAAKDLLAFRYREQFAAKPICVDELIEKCKLDMKISHLLPTKRTLLYRTLFALPFAYRLFRIINDPSMLEWEQKQKSRK